MSYDVTSIILLFVKIVLHSLSLVCTYELKSCLFFVWNFNFNYFHTFRVFKLFIFYNLCMIIRCLGLNEKKEVKYYDFYLNGTLIVSFNNTPY